MQTIKPKQSVESNTSKTSPREWWMVATLVLVGCLGIIAGPLFLFREAQDLLFEEIPKVHNPLLLKLRLYTLEAVALSLIGFLPLAVALAKRLYQQMSTAEEDLASAQRSAKLKGEFLANASHEIRTPLNGIVGMTQLALETPLNPDQEEYLRMVDLSAKSLVTLVNDILDYSKIEANKLEIENRPFNLHRLVEMTTSFAELSGRTKNLIIVANIMNDVPQNVVGDQHRLQQVLLNLLGNAIKFTPAEGGITFTVEATSREGDIAWIDFTVSDTGIGVAKEKQEEIFKPFAQATSSTARHFGGTGLGLTIASRLANLMGGDISIRSIEGYGTAFRVHMPLTQLQSDSASPVYTTSKTEPFAEPQSLSTALPSTGTTRKVLIAEDNAVNQRLLSILLKKRGIEHTIVDNGREAVRLATTEPFDIVLMDIQMPVMGGVEATTQIRKSEAVRGTHIPIVALTAHAMKGDREEFLEAGMDDYLSKPLDAKELFTKIDTILGSPR